MTITRPGVDEAAIPAPTASPAPDLRRLALAILPWLMPAAVLLAVLHDTGTPIADIGRYTLYFILAIVLPGTLVHRALRGSTGNLPEDLGLGAATGLVVMLLGWATAAATGLQALLAGWPLLVVVLFVAVPRLRRHWRIADPRPLPLRWSWIVAAGLSVLPVMLHRVFTETPLPPATAVYYQDLLYHLALVHEMTRSMPFQVPQLAGDTLRYHYLSDADMAVASMLTGIDPMTVLARLWIVPMAGITVFVTAAMTRQLSGKWWAGALGGVAAVVGLPLSVGGAVTAFGGSPISYFSPSQVYVYPLLGLLILLAVDLLRGRELRWAWVAVPIVALAAAGAKSSALPPVVAGLLLACAVLLFRERKRLPVLLGFLGLVLAAMVTGLKVFAGGGAGTLGLQPFALLWWFPPYRQTIGAGDGIDGDRLLPPGVANAGAAGAVFLAGILLWWLLTQTPRLLGIAGIGLPATRRDPVTWLFAGLAAAGTGAAWAFWHPSLSQLYFFATVAPFGTVATVWLLADRARGWRPVVGGLLAGGLWCAFAPAAKAPATRSTADWGWAMLWPWLLAGAAAVVVLALGLLAGRRLTGRFAWGAVPVAIIAALVGGGLGTQLKAQVPNAVNALEGRKPPAGKADRRILRDELSAALWLDRTAGRDDMVATNVHCTPIGWKSACDARAFWVAGVGGRRTVVESWGYTDQTVARDGENGKRYQLQPAPYPERFAVNRRAFAQGDPAAVAQLIREYDVRWFFADSRAQGGVSPALAQVPGLRLAHTAGPVTIYQVLPRSG